MRINLENSVMFNKVTQPVLKIYDKDDETFIKLDYKKSMDVYKYELVKVAVKLNFENHPNNE